MQLELKSVGPYYFNLIIIQKGTKLSTCQVSTCVSKFDQINALESNALQNIDRFLCNFEILIQVTLSHAFTRGTEL